MISRPVDGPRLNRRPRSGLRRRTRLSPPSLLFALVLLLALWLSPLGIAAAHTQLLQGSPGPAQRAGGTVDFIDLIFVEPVSEVEIELEDPSGNLIEGEMVVSDGQIIRFEMPALTETGRYIIRYTMLSADGDISDSAYFFTYHPDATQPVRLGDVDVPSNASTIATIAAGAVFVACIIGLAMIFLTRLERGRSARQAQNS